MHERRVVVATTAIQTLLSMAVLVLPAVTPAAAAALGVDAALIGFQVSLVFGAAMVTVLFGGQLVRRLGGCRASQMALILCAAGCLLASLPSLSAIAAGSIVIGFAYGLPSPAAAHLLARFTNRGRLNLIFSLKQSGVPLGGVLAGIIGPSLALAVSWQAPLLLAGVLALVLAALLEPVRAVWDDDRRPDTKIYKFPLDGFTLVFRGTALRGLAGAGIMLSVIQVSLISFLVVVLVHDLGFDSVVAGLLLASLQTASVCGRVLWGWLADSIGNGLSVMLVLTVTMTGTLALAWTFGPTSPSILVVGAYLVLGATAASWNGIFMAESVRLSDPSRVSDVTACMLFFAWSGALVGPTCFALAQPHFGSALRTYPLLVAAALGACGFVAVAAAAARTDQSARCP